MIKKFTLLTLAALVFIFSGKAQMTIGSASAPNPNSVLELVSPANNQGFVLPRIPMTAGQALTSPAPLTGATLQSTMIYNTTTGFGSGVGIYYWDGTKWNFVANASSLPSGWLLIGNTGTTPSTAVIGSPVNNNFIGTTDAQDFVVASNNKERLRVTSNGNIGIGTKTPDASALLQLASTTQGISFPTMTTAQRNLIPSPLPGLTVYNTTTGCLEFHVGTQWQPIGCACTSAPATPSSIISSDPALGLCPSTPHTFSIAPVAGASSYTWTASSSLGSNLDGTGSNTEVTSSTTIQATFTTGGAGTLTVTASNACGTSVGTSTLNIGVTPTPAAPSFTTSTINVCSGGAGYTYSVGPVTYASGYTWTAPTGATITVGATTYPGTYTGTSNSVVITFASTTVLNNPGTIMVSASNGCGTSATTNLNVSINSIPATPVFNIDPLVVCSTPASNIYSVNPVSNAVSYTWTRVTAGITFNGAASPYNTTLNSLGVVFPATPTTASFNISATNTCGTSSAQNSGSITVNSVPGNASAISGPTQYCKSPNLNVYSIGTYPGTTPTNATSIQWTVTPATAIIYVSGVAQTNPYIGNATNISVDFGTGGGSFTVQAVGMDGCGNGGTASLAVTALPVPSAGTISGNATPCAGSTSNYTIAGATNATNYTWTVTGGTVTTTGFSNPSTLTTVAVTWGSGTTGIVNVTANNCNGSTAATPFSITLGTLPSFPPSTVITATTTSPAPYPADPGPYWENQIVVFSVPAATGATGYTWTLPTGATGTSSTNSITVNLGKTTAATGTTISVVATNTCGNSSSVSYVIQTCYAPGSASYFYTTGVSQSFSVPGCVTQLTCTLAGAQGGMSYSGGPSLSAGANGGAVVKSVVAVIPGTALTVYVAGHGTTGTTNKIGGIGGINGSGYGSGGGTTTVPNTAIASGGGGGASSEIWVAGTRALVAGGGGGGGFDYIYSLFGTAPSGGPAGQNGSNGGSAGSVNYAGKGATQAAGGAGGTAPTGSGASGTAGTAGTAIVGGTGGLNDYTPGPDYSGAGGGGGGWYGGGGGADAGGGGGSSNYANATNFTPAVPTYTTNGNVATNVSTGVDGYILVTW